MSKYSHQYVENYDDMIGLGMDRETDEKTVICYLQMISDDACSRELTSRMSEDQLKEVFVFLTRLLKKHFSEAEYHRYFLKENHSR